MGNTNSSQNPAIQSPTQNKLSRLEARIRSLENLDKDQDGIVTRSELDNWLKEQSADLKTFKEQLIQMKDRECQSQISEYQKQIDSLKSINVQLEAQLVEALSQPKESSNSANIRPETKVFGEASKSHINEIINNLLTNENVNVKYLPDFVEKQLYRNMFSILLGLLDELIKTTNIELLGHEITMSLAPKKEETAKKTT